jgi:hypothetical protein
MIGSSTHSQPGLHFQPRTMHPPVLVVSESSMTALVLTIGNIRALRSPTRTLEPAWSDVLRTPLFPGLDIPLARVFAA